MARILFVDDDPSIRRVTERTARQWLSGHEILIAENSSQALGILEAQKIDLIVTDRNMTFNEEGVELLMMVRQRWPKTIRILFCSYCADVSPEIAQYRFQKPDHPKLMDALGDLAGTLP